MNAVQESMSLAAPLSQREIQGFEVPVDARTAARFLGVTPHSTKIVATAAKLRSLFIFPPFTALQAEALMGPR